MTMRSRGEGQQKLTGTGVGTNAGVTVTVTAPSGAKPIVTHISGSGDVAAVVTLEIPTGTVVWRRRETAAFKFDVPFTYGEYEGVTGGSTASVKISASTSNCEANIGGLAGSLG